MKDKDVVGLQSLAGEKVLLLCANYFYAGTLLAADESVVQLADASIVYETGSWDSKSYDTAERLPGKKWNVCVSMIESYGIGK
jgi:hypothetical protein